MIQINGISVHPPKEFEVEIMDIHAPDGGRNTRGNMVFDIVGVKRKLICKWGYLTNSQISQILQACKGGYFTVRYPDPMLGTYTTKTFYKGDRSNPIYSVCKGKVLWSGLNVNFIER